MANVIPSTQGQSQGNSKAAFDSWIKDTLQPQVDAIYARAGVFQRQLVVLCVADEANPAGGGLHLVVRDLDTSKSKLILRLPLLTIGLWSNWIQCLQAEIQTMTAAQTKLDEALAQAGQASKGRRKYQLLTIIAEGSYGVVFKAREEATNEIVAIKYITKVDASVSLKEDHVRRMWRELQIMKFSGGITMSLRDVALLPGPESGFDHLFLIMDFVKFDLREVLDCGVLTEPQVKYVMFQLVLGLYGLHQAGILHRDIKPDNVLLNENFHVKIGDLGLGRTADTRVKENTTGMFSARWYCAPEVDMDSGKYDYGMDVWSCACVMAELYTPGGKPLFPGPKTLSPYTQMETIFRVLGTPSKEDLGTMGASNLAFEYMNEKSLHCVVPGVDFQQRFRQPGCSDTPIHPDALDLLTKMLVPNPAKRITMLDALRHPYFKEHYTPEKEVVPDMKFTMEPITTSSSSDGKVRELRRQLREMVQSYYNEQTQKQMQKQQKPPTVTSSTTATATCSSSTPSSTPTPASSSDVASGLSATSAAESSSCGRTTQTAA